MLVHVNVAGKDIKFVIYGVSFEQSDVNILITQYETFEKKKRLRAP